MASDAAVLSEAGGQGDGGGGAGTRGGDQQVDDAKNISAIRIDDVGK